MPLDSATSADDLVEQLTGSKPKPPPRSIQEVSAREQSVGAEKEAALAPIEKRVEAGFDKERVASEEQLKRLTDEEKDFTPPPKPPENNPWKAFAAPATLFGLIAGAFTKTPAIAGMKAATAAINAQRAGDLETYKQQYDQWKENQELVMKRHELIHQEYESARELYKDDLERGNWEYQRVAAKFGDKVAMLQLQAGNIEMVQKLNLERARLANEMQNAMPKLQEARDVAVVAQQAIADKTKELGRPLTPAEQSQVRLDTRAQEQAKALGLKPSGAKEADAEALAMDAFRAANGRDPGAADAPEMARLRMKERQEAGGVITDDAADFAAGRVIAGDERALIGFARSVASITKVTNSIVRLAKERGLSPEEVADRVAEFQGVVAGERTLGTREANMGTAANEVKNMIPLALDASRKVDRTQFPTLNGVLLSAERGTGDENVVRFGLAANSLIYTYAKFLNPTGIPTDADKARATDILSTGWAQGQFEAAIDQIQKEIQSGRAAIGQTRQEFRDRGARENVAPPSVGAPADGAAPPKPNVDPATLLQGARSAIAAGADRDAVISRLKAWGIDTGGL